MKFKRQVLGIVALSALFVAGVFWVQVLTAPQDVAPMAMDSYKIQTQSAKSLWAVLEQQDRKSVV